MTRSRLAVPHDIVAKLRLHCLDLPESYEERAWVGLRWMVGKKNFAHVLMIDAGWPPAYARAAKSCGPLCVLTFRASYPALDSPRFANRPFFRPVWFKDIVGREIDSSVDWDEVAELVQDSYCVLAPKKLVALVRGN